MRTTTSHLLRKLAALCLAAIFVVQSVAFSLAGYDGAFVLYVTTAQDTVVEPELVRYTDGQTLAQAIEAAGIALEYTDGVLEAVDGVYGGYSICMDGGAFDLAQNASGISAVYIAEHTGDMQYALPLLRTMPVYLENKDHVQNYAPAEKAYTAAVQAIRTGDDAAVGEAQTQLQAALAEFDALLSGTRYSVKVEALLGDAVLTDAEVVFTDAYGNETAATAMRAQLHEGEYTFCVTHGRKCVRGSLTVRRDTTLTVHLPEGVWFGEVRLTDSSKEDYPAAYDAQNGTWTMEVPDTAGAGDVYLYASQGPDVPDAQDTRLFAKYVGTDGTDYGSVPRRWESSEVCLESLVQSGTDGAALTLAAETVGSDGYTTIQTCAVRIVRTPTLCSLTVSANGVRLPLPFDPLQTEYSVTTAADAVQIKAQGRGADYAVQGCGTVMLADDTTHTVAVTAAGQTRVYTLRFVKHAAVQVTLTVPDGTSVVVRNAAGETILPKDGSFILTDGEEYTYDATCGDVYHTSAPFIAADGLHVTVAQPLGEDKLLSLALYNAGSARTRTAYEMQPAFSAAAHTCAITVEDAAAALYAQATASDGWTVTAMYERQTANAETNGTPFEKEIATPVSSDGSATFLNGCITRSGYGRTVTIRVSREADGVTAYQDYTLCVRRSLHLSALSATQGGLSLLLRDTAGEITAFSRGQTEYTLEAEPAVRQILLRAACTQASDGGYFLHINGETADDAEEYLLDISYEAQQTVTVEVCHADPDAIPTTYTLHVRVLPTVSVRLRVSPADACVFLRRADSGARVLPAADGYPLVPGASYAYTVTAYGYIAETAAFTAPQTDAEIEIALQTAPETAYPQLSESWRAGRSDAYNNGVTDAKTPISAEEATLYWATKLGDGTGSDACGCPIVVGDYLFTYAGSYVYKLDPVSGEVLARGEMDRRSGFAIQTPTYAEGMLFVALSDGTVQAFCADTLESLWLYRNARGGQPNSPIAYRNGYIYTGFWLDERTDADFVCLSITDEDPASPLEEKLPSWTYTHAGGFYWAGAYAGEGYVLVGTEDGAPGSSSGFAQLVSLDERSGLVLDAVTLPHPGDVRSGVTFVPGTSGGTAYFTTRSGWFDAVSVAADGTLGEVRALRLENGVSGSAPMSTSTPTVYAGRAYVGVSGASQFTPYSGHAIDVIDLIAWRVAYTVPTQGFPQTSGLLTTAYEAQGGEVYVYFFDNQTPGKLRVLRDKPEQTSPVLTTEENGQETAYVLFTPVGAHAQYALCSPDTDAYGTLFFKNDSGCVFALGSAIRKLTVTRLPDTCAYTAGDVFDPTGLVVTAEYANGMTRDVTRYVRYSTEPLTETDTQFWITFPYALYSDAQGVGTQILSPFAVLELTVAPQTVTIGDVDADGALTAADAQRIYAFLAGELTLTAAQLLRADYNGDGLVDTADAQAICAFLTQRKQ